MATQAINARYEILEATPGPETPPYTLSKARDRDEGRVVALQVLPAGILGTSELRQQFQRAVRQAQTLSHTSILQVYDQGVAEETGDPYIVRESIRGITLQERIRRIAPFTLAVSADIAVSVAEALAAAHRSGIAHGDLRPGHVLLSPEGQIKTADFAYGAVVAGQTREPSREAYLAPELTSDAAPTVAGDLFAFGAMLYEMLTGVLPLAGGTRVSSPRAVNPGIPPALDGLVQKALSADLGIRYRSADALLADLQTIRAALRTGKPLTWSPLTDRQPAEKQSSEKQLSEKRTPRPSAMPSENTLTGAAQELAEERRGKTRDGKERDGKNGYGKDDYGKEDYGKEDYGREENVRDARRVREPASALGIATNIMFVFAILGVIGLVWYGTKFLEVPNDVQVPNLIGKTFDDAKRIAAQQHFTLVESPDSDYSDSMPENQIYQQIPLAGHTIKADKEVTVYRSLGPRLLVVPALVGTTQDYAGKALQQANLPLGTITQEYSEKVPAGVVIRQSPDSGSKVARNTAVNFVASKGKQPPETPSAPTATATGPDKADLSWQAAPRADSYTIIRSLDGDSATVARDLAGTHFSDTGLKPDTTYSYTVAAVNAAGSSDPSEAALVTTQASADTQPVLPPDAVVAPPADGSATTPDQTVPPADTTPKTARLRQFTIQFKVPRRPRRIRHVQIEVQDTTGTNLVYDESHDPGDTVSAPEQGFGNKITFRIFLDSKLVKQQTF